MYGLLSEKYATTLRLLPAAYQAVRMLGIRLFIQIVKRHDESSVRFDKIPCGVRPTPRLPGKIVKTISIDGVSYP